MVRLRDFEVPIGDGEVTVPWVHVPVAPSVVQLLGRRTVIVDPARAPNGVRPCTVIDPSPEKTAFWRRIIRLRALVPNRLWLSRFLRSGLGLAAAPGLA